MIYFEVLIIDDHPVIASAYKSALAKIETIESYRFNYIDAVSITEAIKILDEVSESFFDIIFLDIKLPKTDDNLYLSGEDLGGYIKKKHPESKIIVATTYNDNYRINNILKTLNPDGFLIKNDMVPKDLVSGIIEVIKKPPHYSNTVRQLIRRQLTSDVFLDKLDRQIIYELSIGTRMTELPKVIPLSLGAIEKRKRQMKELFDMPKATDRELIQAARNRGFI